MPKRSPAPPVRKLSKAELIHAKRVQGCLFGLAIGDALGAPVEFHSRDEILATYGPHGVQDFAPWGRFPAGAWTDDTQMTLATMAGMVDMFGGVLAGAPPAPRKEGGFALVNPITLVHERYLAWYRTQTDPFHNRVPGNTCLQALASGRIGLIDEPINASKGCGGAMRTAPVGLWIDPPDAFQMGAEFAAITHGHPSGYLPAGLIAELVAHLRGGKALPAAVTAAKRTLKKFAGHEETLAKLALAQALAKKTAAGKLAAPAAIAQLGQGWVGHEAVAIAVYCALAHPTSYKQAVLAAVNITGDSDSTGALTGALMGTLAGYDKLPRAWRDGVEAADALWDAGKTFFLAGLALWDADPYGGME